MPPGLCALRDDDVDARIALRQGMLGFAAQRSDEQAARMESRHELRRRSSQCVDDQLHLGMPQGEFDLLPCTVRSGRPLTCRESLADLSRLVLRQVGNAPGGQEVRNEPLVLHGDEFVDRYRGIIGTGLEIFGNENVDAIGASLNVLIDPLQFDLELFRGEGDGTQHTETTRSRDLDDDIAAMRERENRYLTTQSITDACAHGINATPSSCRIVLLG